MTDFKGQELNVGDKVIFVKRNSMYYGKIESFTPKQCKVRMLNGDGSYRYMYTIQHPSFEILKLDIQ